MFPHFRDFSLKFSREPQVMEGRENCGRNQKCFNLRVPMNYTMLQAYNCDRQKPGQKTTVMPAEKQFYRPSYVKQHFIHYSTITAMSEMNREEFDEYWKGERQFNLKQRVFPDPLSRFGDEVNEGTWLTAKLCEMRLRLCFVCIQSI